MNKESEKVLKRKIAAAINKKDMVVDYDSLDFRIFYKTVIKFLGMYDFFYFGGPNQDDYSTNCKICGAKRLSSNFHVSNEYETFTRYEKNYLFVAEIGICVECYANLQILPLPEQLGRLYILFKNLNPLLTATTRIWSLLPKEYYSIKVDTLAEWVEWVNNK